MKKILYILFVVLLMIQSCSENDYRVAEENNTETDNQNKSNIKEISLGVGFSYLDAEEEEMEGGGAPSGSDLVGIQIRETNSYGTVVAAGLFRGVLPDLKVKLDLNKRYYIEATVIKNGLNVTKTGSTYGEPFNRSLTNPAEWAKNPTGFTGLYNQTRNTKVGSQHIYVPQERWYYYETIDVPKDLRLKIQLKRVSFQINYEPTTGTNQESFICKHADKLYGMCVTAQIPTKDVEEYLSKIDGLELNKNDDGLSNPKIYYCPNNIRDAYRNGNKSSGVSYIYYHSPTTDKYYQIDLCNLGVNNGYSQTIKIDFTKMESYLACYIDLINAYQKGVVPTQNQNFVWLYNDGKYLYLNDYNTSADGQDCEVSNYYVQFTCRSQKGSSTEVVYEIIHEETNLKVSTDTRNRAFSIWKKPGARAGDYVRVRVRDKNRPYLEKIVNFKLR